MKLETFFFVIVAMLVIIYVGWMATETVQMIDRRITAEIERKLK